MGVSILCLSFKMNLLHYQLPITTISNCCGYYLYTCFIHHNYGSNSI